VLASLVLRLSNIYKQQLAEFHYSLTESASLEVSKQSIIDEDVVVLKTVRWLLLPGRNTRTGKLWADTDRKTTGAVHYTLDSHLAQDNSYYDGKVVRLDHLFIVRDIGLAFVTYGKRGNLDNNTGCYSYNFSEDDQGRWQPRVILASRLRSYVHFGFVHGKLLFNRSEWSFIIN